MVSFCCIQLLPFFQPSLFTPCLKLLSIDQNLKWFQYKLTPRCANCSKFHPNHDIWSGLCGMLEKISSKASKVLANPSPSIFWEAPISLKKSSPSWIEENDPVFKGRTSGFLLKRTPLPHSKYYWDALGFHTTFYKDFGTKVMTWNYLYRCL